MDWITFSSIGLTDIGAGSLVILTVIGLLTGRIYPRSVVRELREDYTSRVNHWKQAYESMAAAREDQAKQLDEFSVAVHMMRAALQSDQKQSEEGGSSNVEKTP